MVRFEFSDYSPASPRVKDFTSVRFPIRHNLSAFMKSTGAMQQVSGANLPAF
jgi:hypothetical protein